MSDYLLQSLVEVVVVKDGFNLSVVLMVVDVFVPETYILNTFVLIGYSVRIGTG